MTHIVVSGFDEWRTAARRLLRDGVPPERTVWSDAGDVQGTLPLATTAPAFESEPSPERRIRATVPRRFVELARLAACHRSPSKWPLAYRVLWRLQHDTRELLNLPSDDDVRGLEQMAQDVRRDEHKMRAFVRFTPVGGEPVRRYVAWYEPDHLILRLAAPFFADRFASMRWSILTPDLCAHWDDGRLTFSPGVSAPPNAADDAAIQALWRTYYGAMFNPARVNLRATLREMPLRRWRGLPEASMIPSLVASAHERTVALGRASGGTSARAFVPQDASLPALREAAAACQGCALHSTATQTVFGQGPTDAALVLVGEQPGDSEDRDGRPFVGPAGEVLDRALAAAGIERDTVYVTNAVKHFAFVERGKRRIHRTPRMSEVHACRPWLEAELQRVKPRCVVCLGGTAARSLLGPQARVMALRGAPVEGTAWAPAVVVTVHPSAVLRADAAEAYFEMLVSDLRTARQAALRSAG